jgi:hypothetical protein
VIQHPKLMASVISQRNLLLMYSLPLFFSLSLSLHPSSLTLSLPPFYYSMCWENIRPAPGSPTRPCCGCGCAYGASLVFVVKENRHDMNRYCCLRFSAIYPFVVFQIHPMVIWEGNLHLHGIHSHPNLSVCVFWFVIAIWVSVVYASVEVVYMS